MRIALRALVAAALVTLLAGAALAQNYVATLDGLQETPPNASPASGSATLTLDAAKMLTVHVDCAALIGTMSAAHIHCCAPPGVAAGVKFGLVGPRPPVCPIDHIVGPLTPVDEANLNNGLMYINIHTNVFPGGEIRGQILHDTVGVEPSPWGRVKTLYQ